MRFFILSLCLLFLSLSTATAQDTDSHVFVTPGSNFNNNASNIARALQEHSFQKATRYEPNIIHLTLVKPDTMQGNEFAIIMHAPQIVTGCFDFTPLEYKTKMVNNHYLSVNVKSFRREAQSHGKCDTRNQTISNQLVLDADDLRSRGIKQIRFSNKRAIDHFDINFDQGNMILRPQSMVAFKPTQLTGVDKDHVIFNLGGHKNIVALHVPMARDGEDVTNAVRQLAYSHSLLPAFDQAGLEKHPNVYYFKDDQNMILEGLKQGSYIEFGQISVLRPYATQDGLAKTPQELKVFATHAQTKL